MKKEVTGNGVVIGFSATLNVNLALDILQLMKYVEAVGDEHHFTFKYRTRQPRVPTKLLSFIDESSYPRRLYMVKSVLT
jgi:hypothetical protein